MEDMSVDSVVCYELYNCTEFKFITLTSHCPSHYPDVEYFSITALAKMFLITGVTVTSCFHLQANRFCLFL